MAGSGAAVRLHEFRELDGPDTVTPKSSRLGRDVHGLYPGQLGRVHTVHPKDCGFNLHGEKSPSLQSPDPPSKNCWSFDVQTLRALTVLHHSPAAGPQRPPQTAYQEHYGLQSPLFPQQ